MAEIMSLCHFTIMKIRNTFYNIDFIKPIPLSMVSDDEKIFGKIYTAIPGDDVSLEKFREKFPEVDLIDHGAGSGGKDIIFANRDRHAIKAYCRENGLTVVFPSHICIKKSIPGGYLFSGWRTGRKTKIRPEDLPKSFVYVSNYKKHGYIQTAEVKDVFYMPSPFHNHTFRDDFLFLSYKGAIDPENPWKTCGEYIFGNDIVNVIFGIEKNSPDVKRKVKEIKGDMIKQYNLYIKEMKSMGWKRGDQEMIRKLEELLI